MTVGSSSFKTVEFKAPGSCCTECALQINQSLRREPGVAEVQILSSAERVVVAFDDTRVTPTDLKQKIQDLGYRVEEEPERSPIPKRRAIWTETIRLAFIGLVAAIALLEILGKSLGFLEKAGEWIPLPVALLLAFSGGTPSSAMPSLGSGLDRSTLIS